MATDFNWRDQTVEQIAHVLDPHAFSGVGYGAGAAEQSRESALDTAASIFDRVWPNFAERLVERAQQLDRDPTAKCGNYASEVKATLRALSEDAGL